MKKHLSIVLSLALAAVLLPAAFAQSGSSSAPQQDQTSPSTQSPSMPSAQSPSTPSSQSPSTSPSESPSTPSSQSPSSQSPSSQSPSTSSQSPSESSSSASSSSASNSFTGTVTKSGDKYVLKTDSGDTYQLDDQEKAKEFEGKEVKVNGNLDKSTSMLHVTDISPASSR